MIVTEHPDATCPNCGESVYYGTKEEATLWKVYYTCDDCVFDRWMGMVSRSAIDHIDEVEEKAEEMGEKWA